MNKVLTTNRFSAGEGVRKIEGTTLRLPKM